MSLVYLNGAYRPLAEAAVNVLDRGFTFGDGVYEVIPVYNRRVFCGAAHLARLDNSLRAIHMANPLSRADWAAVFARLIEALAEPDQSIYLQITRGPAEREHAMPRQTRPTVFAMSRPLARHDVAQGIRAITHEDIRWQCCDIKAITLLASVLLRRRAEERGAREAILLRDDTLTEGAASNVFICNKGVVSTPEQDRHVLPGITRGVLIDLLRENAMACRENPSSARNYARPRRSGSQVQPGRSPRSCNSTMPRSARASRGRSGPGWTRFIRILSGSLLV